MTMNDGSDKILNYYQKFSQNSNLPKYFSGSSIQCSPGANDNITGDSGDSDHQKRPIQVAEETTCIQKQSANNSPKCSKETPFQNYVGGTMESDSKEDIRYLQYNKETNLQKCVSLPDISNSKNLTLDQFVPKLKSKVENIIELPNPDPHSVNNEESTESKTSVYISSNNNRQISSSPPSSHSTNSSSNNTHTDVHNTKGCKTSSSCSESEESKILEFKRTLSYLKAKIGLPDAQSTPYIHLNESKKKHISNLIMKPDSKVCTLDPEKCVQQPSKQKLKLSISTPVCINWTCPKAFASNSSSKTVQTEVSAKDTLVCPSQIYSKTVQTELKDCLGGSSTVYSKTIQTELLAEENMVDARVGPSNMFPQTLQMEHIHEENRKSYEEQAHMEDKSKLTSSSEHVSSDSFEDNFNCVSKCGSFEYVDAKAALSKNSKEENSLHISNSKILKSLDISDILSHYSKSMSSLSSKESHSETIDIENHVKQLQQLLNTKKLELSKKKYYIKSLIKGITDFDLSNPQQRNTPGMTLTEPKQIISSCANLQETHSQNDLKKTADKLKKNILYSSDFQNKRDKVTEKKHKKASQERNNDLIAKQNDSENDEDLLEFAKNEKAYQINWIDTEISHLTKLKTILESNTTCKKIKNEKTSQPIIPAKTSVYRILQTDGTKINSESEYVIQQTVDIQRGQKINYDLDGQKYSVINCKNPQTLSESALDSNDEEQTYKSVCADIKIMSEKNHTNIKVSQLCNVCQQVCCGCQSDFPENLEFQDENVCTEPGTKLNSSPSYDNSVNCLICKKFQCTYHNKEIPSEKDKPLFHTNSNSTSSSAERLTSVDVGQNTFNSLEKIFHKCCCTRQEKKCNCSFVNSLYHRFFSHSNKHSAKDISGWDYEDAQCQTSSHKCHEHILKSKKYTTDFNKLNNHVNTQTSREMLTCNCFKKTQTKNIDKIRQPLNTTTTKNVDYTQDLLDIHKIQPNIAITKELTTTDLQPSTQPVKNTLEEKKLEINALQTSKLPLENKNACNPILNELDKAKSNKEIGVQAEAILKSKSLQTSLEKNDNKLLDEATKEVDTKNNKSKFLQVGLKKSVEIGIQAAAPLGDKNLQTSLEQIDRHRLLNEPTQKITRKSNKSKLMQVEYRNSREIGNQAEGSLENKSLQTLLDQNDSNKLLNKATQEVDPKSKQLQLESKNSTEIGIQAEATVDDKSLQTSLEQIVSHKLLNEFIQVNPENGKEIGVQSNITSKSYKKIGIQADRPLKSKSLQTIEHPNKNELVENNGNNQTNKIAENVKSKYSNSKYTQIKSKNLNDIGIQVDGNTKMKSSQTIGNVVWSESKDSNVPAEDDKTKNIISNKTHIMKPESNKEIGVQVDGFQTKYIQTNKYLENDFLQNKEKSHTKRVDADVNTKQNKQFFSEHKDISNYDKIQKGNKLKSHANTQVSPSIQTVTSTEKTTSDEMSANFKNSKGLGSSTLTSEHSRIRPLFRITCIFCKKNLHIDEISKIPNLQSLYAVCNRCFSNEPEYSVSAVNNKYGFLRLGQGTTCNKCCRCCQPKPRKRLVVPTEVAYTLTIKSQDSSKSKRQTYNKNKNEFKSYKGLDRKRKKNQEDSKENSAVNQIHHTKHGKDSPLHEKDTSNNCESGYALTEYLIINRPEFICSAEARRQKVLQSKILRVQQMDNVKLNFLDNKFNELPPREVNKLFTEREMKKLNKKTRQKLPEVQNKLFDARNRRLRDAEKLICHVFSKKVQQSVLRGKPTFSIENSIT